MHSRHTDTEPKNFNIIIKKIHTFVPQNQGYAPKNLYRTGIRKKSLSATHLTRRQRTSTQTRHRTAHKHHFHSLRTPKFMPHHAHCGQHSHPRKRTTARADNTQPHERTTAPRTNDAHTCHTKDTHACCTSDTHACRTSSSPHTLPRATFQPAPQRFRA